MKKIARGVMRILLAGIVLLGTGCSGKAVASDANLGRYTCRSVSMGGMTDDPNGEYIELKPNHKLSIAITENAYDGEYRLDDEKFTLVMNGEDDSFGTLKDGILQLEIAGLAYTFVREDLAYSVPSASASAFASFAGSSSKAETAAADWSADEIWHGRWIGSMYMDEAQGSYAAYEGVTVTAVANCDAENGRSYFDLFLPANGYSEDDNAAFLSMYVSLDQDHMEIDDENGWVTDMIIGKEDDSDFYIIFTPNHGNLISFSSRYVSPADSGDSFRFTVEMRKNGSAFDENYDTFPIELADAYASYRDYLYSDSCTKNVVDGVNGEVLIDRGSPVYVPGAAKPDTAVSAPSAAADEYQKFVDGRVVSLNGYFSMTVPAGWDYQGITLDSNQIYVNKDDVQINIQLDYLNGYTVQQQAHRRTFSTDTYEYDSTIPEGTAIIDGRTFYTAGPAADHGNLYYYLFSEWQPNPEQFINMSVMIFNTTDRDRMAPVLASEAYQTVVNSLQINDK